MTMFKMGEGNECQIAHYPTGEEIHVGDVIEMEWSCGRRRGRVLKCILPSKIDPNEYNWDLPDGGILMEMDEMGLFAVDYDFVEDELHFVSRGC